MSPLSASRDTSFVTPLYSNPCPIVLPLSSFLSLYLFRYPLLFSGRLIYFYCTSSLKYEKKKEGEMRWISFAPAPPISSSLLLQYCISTLLQSFTIPRADPSCFWWKRSFTRTLPLVRRTFSHLFPILDAVRVFSFLFFSSHSSPLFFPFVLSQSSRVLLVCLWNRIASSWCVSSSRNKEFIRTEND